MEKPDFKQHSMAFRRGYEYADETLAKPHMGMTRAEAIERLQACADTARLYVTYNDFDRGVEARLSEEIEGESDNG